MNYTHLNQARSILLLLLALTSHEMWLTPVEAQGISQLKPVSRMNFQSTYKNYRERFLGIAPNRRALFTIEKDEKPNRGYIVSWNIDTNKVAQQTPLTKWLSAFNMALSVDGRYLITDNDHISQDFTDAKGYRVTALSTSDFQMKWARPIGKDQNSGIFLPVHGDSQQMIVGIQKMIPVKGENDAFFGPIHYEFTNLSTAKVEKKLNYEHAGGASSVTASPGKKYLACAFTNNIEETLTRELDRKGVVDILDAKSGKILWHLQGSDKQPVGDPLFFISPTRFISAGTVLDIQKRTAHHWSAVNDKSRCLAAVPHHPNYALFLTPGGLQLRNWSKNKTLVSWPTLKESGRITFSPDLSLFAFKRGAIVQFWKFDSKWLK